MQALFSFVFLAIAFASFSVRAQPAKLGIHGEDNREQYNFIALESGALKNVGYLRTITPVSGGTRTSTCSAFLIAPDLVLTAAHCLYYPGGSMSAQGEVEFWLGYNGGAVASSAVYRARELVVHPEWGSGFNPVNDLGLVALDRRATSDGAAISGFAALEEEVKKSAALPQLTVVGYPGTREGRIFFAPSREYGIANGRLLLHKAAMEQGQSGGPVIWDNKIIGVHSFISASTNASLAFDSALLQLITEWKSRYSRF